MLKTQYEVVQIEEVENSTLFEILDNPEIPLSRSSPIAKMIMLITIVTSIIISIIFIYLKEVFFENILIKKLFLFN